MSAKAWRNRRRRARNLRRGLAWDAGAAERRYIRELSESDEYVVPYDYAEYCGFKGVR